LRIKKLIKKQKYNGHNSKYFEDLFWRQVKQGHQKNDADGGKN
jgi:hypothetical protein